MTRKLTLRVKDEHTVSLGGLDVFLTRLLQEVPGAGTPGPGSEGRLFPSPTGGKEGQMDEDWREYVRPELEEAFSESRAVIARDLEGLREVEGGLYEVDIPREHQWEWVHGLNQARVALAAAYGLGEDALEGKVVLEARESLAAFQIQFYALLQEWFLGEDGEGDGGVW